MKRVDLVVHFAAESHVDRSIIGPSLFIKTNVLGTQVLLEAALKAKIKRFHHVSTDEVFGSLSGEGEEKFNEDSPFRPNSPYAASKAASDCLVRAYFKTYGLPISITNCSNNYGPYQFPEKLIPLAITNLIEGKKVPVYGDGMQVRDWLYVEDHCLAIDLIVHNSKTIGETFCVGGMEKRVSNIEVVKKILKIMKKKEDWIEFVKDRPGHDRCYSVNWSKIKKFLGWQPRRDFDSWLERTVNWYQSNKNWWKPLKEKEKNYFKKQYLKG
jgi:dTDP-glucose 4,6-dehydratase